MDKKEFEAAISAYTDKIVDEDCQLVRYVMNKSMKANILDRSGDVIAVEVYRPPKKHKIKVHMGRPFKEVATPMGTFLNIHHAAEAYGKTVVSMRAKINYEKKKSNPEFYFKD